MNNKSLSTDRIRVWVPHEPLSATVERLAFSSGTMLAQAEGYEPAARVPGRPWRTLDVTELAEYCLTATVDPRDTVRIVRFDPRVAQGIMAAYADQRYARSQADQLAACVVLDAILEHGGQADEVQINGLAEQPGGLATVTRDRHRANQWIGLHVDSWSGLPLARRREARIRLCVNVGEHTRYFLFMPRPVATLGEWLTTAAREAGEQTVSLHINDVVRRYMIADPQAPVVRVAVHAGEAYLAPTDNLIHDGSTVNNPGTDRNFNLFGYFNLPA